MKKDLIERLRRFLTAHDMIGTPASDEQVLCAEQELGVKFSSDYIDFIKNFGAAYAGMMINALDGNENVVDETKSFREVHPDVTDTYVISDDGSGNPIMINSKGEVEIYYQLNSSYKCNGIHINNLFKFFVWCEVSKSFTRSII